jgi:hypothetical protein
MAIDTEGWSVSLWDSKPPGAGIIVCVSFPFLVPQKPSLPPGYEDKNIEQIEKIYGDYRRYLGDYYAPWRETLYNEIEKKLSGKGLGFIV